MAIGIWATLELKSSAAIPSLPRRGIAAAKKSLLAGL
jgi:hypothetical protein